LQAGNVLGEHLELLLRSVLSKMQSVDTPSVMQSLLLVFAHLIQTEVMHPALRLHVANCDQLCIIHPFTANVEFTLCEFKVQ